MQSQSLAGDQASAIAAMKILEGRIAPFICEVEFGRE
jgi:hypothetical protein